MTKNDFIMDLIQNGKVDSLKAAEAEWKKYREANGTAREGGYVADFYATLEMGVMDDHDFAFWIAGQSDNARKNRGHFDKIRRLANAIHERYI